MTTVSVLHIPEKATDPANGELYAALQDFTVLLQKEVEFIDVNKRFNTVYAWWTPDFQTRLQRAVSAWNQYLETPNPLCNCSSPMDADSSRQNGMIFVYEGQIVMGAFPEPVLRIGDNRWPGVKFNYQDLGVRFTF